MCAMHTVNTEYCGLYTFLCFGTNVLKIEKMEKRLSEKKNKEKNNSKNREQRTKMYRVWSMEHGEMEYKI